MSSSEVLKLKPISPTAVKRVMNEIKNFHNTLTLELIKPTTSVNLFYVDMSINNNEIYSPETRYKLRFIIPADYPFEAPQVQFIDNIPMHPHIYSNGHICLNILYDNWTPAQTIESISVSIQSMLANNQINERPPNDDKYCVRAPSNPLRTKWAFDDDTV